MQNPYNATKSYNNYRLTDTIKWRPLPNWALFFIEIGRYIQRNKSATIYINFIDDIIPANFISFGVLQEGYLAYKEIALDSNWINNNLSTGDIVYIRESHESDNWRQGEIKKVYEIDNVDEKFNPYVEIESKRPKEKPLFTSKPKTLLLEEVRLGGELKKTSGSKVKLNDTLKPGITKNFPKEIINKIKFFNEDYINLVGFNKEKPFKEFSKSIQLSSNERDKIFKLDDWFYFSDDTHNLININSVKSASSDYDPKAVNIFLDSSASLSYSNLKSEKNVYLINRMKVHEHNIDDMERVSENIIKENLFNTENINQEIISWIKNKEIEVPKGVEFYAYRKI